MALGGSFMYVIIAAVKMVQVRVGVWCNYNCSSRRDARIDIFWVATRVYLLLLETAPFVKTAVIAGMTMG